MEHLTKKSIIAFCLFVFATSFAVNAQDKLGDYVKAVKLYNEKNYQAAQAELVNFIENHGKYADAFKYLRECNESLARLQKQQAKALKKAEDDLYDKETDQIIKLNNQLEDANNELERLRAQLQAEIALNTKIAIAQAPNGQMDELKETNKKLEQEKQALEEQVKQLQRDTTALNEQCRLFRLDSTGFARKAACLDSLQKKQFLGLIRYERITEVIHPEQAQKKEAVK